MRAFASWLIALPCVLAIWPQPSSITTGNKTLWIDDTVSIHIENPEDWKRISGSQTGLPQDIEIIDTATKRCKDALFRQNFIPWKFHPRNSNFEPSSSSSKTQIQRITIRHATDTAAEKDRNQSTSINESYNLRISANGEASLSAPSGIGILRGLTTFTQLFYQHTRGGTYTPYAPASISDTPAFAWRGLNLDVARNFYPLASIEHLLDAMSATKLNKLHLHATDAQSWPLDIPSLPSLAHRGAYQPGLIYSARDIQALQRYGALRGVEVFLEIDLPGHTSSIYHAFPDLIASHNVQPHWAAFAAEPPSGTLKLNSSKVVDFLDTVIGDVAPRVRPYTRYFHTGGDEVNRAAYEYDETVRTSNHTKLREYMTRFINSTHEKVRAEGLTPVVWQEMLLEWDLPLGKDVIVQAWQGRGSVSAIASLGYKVIAGDSDSWYLDCGHGDWLNPIDERGSNPFTGCSPRKNWRQIYSNDIVDGVAPPNQHLVLGGEVHVWSELIDHVNMDTIVWPRAAAAAEVLWSGSRDGNGKYRSIREAAPRLSELRERLVAMHVRAEPIQMPFCLMEPGQCDG